MRVTEARWVDRVAHVVTWPDRPIVPAAVAGVATTIFVAVRLAVVGQGNVARFVMAERAYADPARLPPGVPVLAGNGYDGQFFYRLALDPADLHRSAFGIHLDTIFRLQRIGYPFLAWVLSLGHHGWVPVTLVVVNVAAMSVIGGLGGMVAQDAGRHALWGLLVAGYFGFVFSVGRDLAEPTAFFVELFFLAPGIWDGIVDLRSLDEVYVFAVVVLIGSRRRLAPYAAMILPVLAVVAAHRIVSL